MLDPVITEQGFDVPRNWSGPLNCHWVVYRSMQRATQQLKAFQGSMLPAKLTPAWIKWKCGDWLCLLMSKSYSEQSSELFQYVNNISIVSVKKQNKTNPLPRQNS